MRDELVELRRRLTDRIEALADQLLCVQPVRERDDLRYPGNGGLLITTRGQHRGRVAWFGEGRYGDAIDLIVYSRRCSIAEAISWARSWIGRDHCEPALPSERVKNARRDIDRPRKVELALQVWQEARPPAGTPVETYLVARGLSLPPEAPLRFHPSCPRGSDGERLPAMIALMSDPVTAEPCGVHRTFLLADGSGKIGESPKMMLGGAGVVRLIPDDQVMIGLGLAEGIETGLAIMQLAGWSPVWACGSAGAITTFPVLEGIRALTIFGDADDRTGAGLKAARACAERWAAAGVEATVQMPPAGKDWLDVAAAAA